MKKNSWKKFKRGVLLGICLTMLVLAFMAVPGQAKQATISLSTPEPVKGNTIYATINVENVEDLDAGQFDLAFNPDVLKAVSAENGSIGNMEIPVQWSEVDSKTVRVIFNLEGVNGVTGSGQLARIGFEVIGEGESNLHISNGLLGDTEAKSIDTDWEVDETGGVDADLRDSEAEGTKRTSSGFEMVLTLAGLVTAMNLSRGKQR